MFCLQMTQSRCSGVDEEPRETCKLVTVRRFQRDELTLPQHITKRSPPTDGHFSGSILSNQSLKHGRGASNIQSSHRWKGLQLTFAVGLVCLWIVFDKPSVSSSSTDGVKRGHPGRRTAGGLSLRYGAWGGGAGEG